MSIIGGLKKIFRTVLPESVRASKFFHGTKRLIYRLIPIHDLIYDDDVYEHFNEGSAGKSAAAIVRSVMADLNPKSIIDVGCGAGVLLEMFKKNGCTAYGLEYSSAGVSRCRERGLDVRQFDLKGDSLDKCSKYDAAVSMEVAEHLPDKYADSFVDLLTGLADNIVFTAAHPGQGGLDHVNEQPKEYWAMKFEDRGFVQDGELIRKWSEDWKKADVAVWYHQNLIVVRKK